MNKISLLLILLLLGLTQRSAAQRPEQLFQEALAKNPQLAALELHHQAAQQTALQVGYLPDPQLGVGAFVLPVETRLGAQRFRLSGTQMFPWFGTLEAQRSLAETRTELSVQQIEVQAQALFFQIKTAWLELYEIRSQDSLLSQNLVLLQALRQLTRQQIAAGKAPLSEGMQVELAIQQLEQALALQRIKASRPQYSLNQWLDRPLDTPIQTANTLPAPVQPEGVQDSLVWNHPEFLLLRQQQAIARETIALTDYQRKPQLGLGVDYLLVSPRGDANPAQNGRDILQIKAMVSIPLHQGRFEAKTNAETLRIEALEQQQKALGQSFQRQIAQAQLLQQQALVSYEMLETQLTTTRTTIRLVRTEYENQQAGLEELLRLHMQLIQQSQKQLSAKVDFHRAQAMMERLIVRP